MFLDPFEFANEIARAAGRNLSGLAITQLAWALGNGQGVAREGGELLLVLAHPLKSHPLKLVLARDAGTLASRKARSFEQLEGTFRHHCGRLPLGKKPSSGPWLPVLTGRAQRITPGGSLPPPVNTQMQDYGVDWYDAKGVAIGELFFFTTKNGDLSVYQRVGPSHLALAQVTTAKNLVDTRAVAQGLVPQNEKLEGVMPLAGEPTLMRPPP